MGKYDLTPADLQTGISRVLTEAYASSTISTNPEIIYIVAGPGAGKTSVEAHFKKKFKEKGERAYSINSDQIARFHPYYDDIFAEELPAERYRLTRQFVRPATPIIFDELIKNKINLINENTLDKGESDIELARKLKDNGYRISINIMATELFESRLSCFEREAAMLLAGLTPRGCSKETQLRMYNGFMKEIEQLDTLGLCDDINVFVRGENINRPPVLKYSKGSSEYLNFKSAVVTERNRQREALLSEPDKYLLRIGKARDIISEYGVNETLTRNSLTGLKELQSDFIQELDKDEPEQ